MSKSLPHAVRTSRLITVSIPAHPDFLFDAMQGTDGLSALSDYTVRLLHRSRQVDVQSLLGKSLTITIKTASAARYIHGVIASVTQAGQEGEVNRYFAYEARVVCWFWLATHKKAFRIYQNQSVPEIIREVLEPYGYAFRFELAEQYAPRIYCVQYEETDFQFVSRLLEAEGIHYYFLHEQDHHTLVMSDEVYSHKPVGGYEYVTYFAEDRLTMPQQDYMTHLTVHQDLRPGRYVTDDYNFMMPNADLSACQQIGPDYTRNAAEVYEWPGNYGDRELGERYARQRMQEQHHMRDIRRLRSTARGVVTGALFHLLCGPRTEDNREYLVLSTRYDLKESNYHSVRSAEEAAQHGCRCVFHLTVQCASLPFRPPRTTPKPRTQGPQTAVVVGPEGQEIWTDQYGRVKVHFYWDRYDNKDENSSCWIRVASGWAGSHFGAMQVPRIGDEVSVDFINGDPDHPIITGRVYNAAKMPPWKLPENATQMGIYSRSSPDGHARSANILRFEDKADHEEVYVHAQKDCNIKVRNNYSKRINVNKIESVGHNKGIEVTNNYYEVIGGDMALFVGPAQKGRFTPQNASEVFEGLPGVPYGLGKPGVAPQGAGTMQISVEKNKTERIGSSHSQLIQKNKSVNVRESYYLDVADELVIHAGKRIFLKCGQSVILLHSDGSIQINGKTLSNNVSDIIRLVSDLVKVN